MRVLRCAAVPEALAEDWCRGWSAWFGAEQRPLPEAPNATELSLVSTALGELVAKRHRPTSWKAVLTRLGARPPRARLAFLAARELLRAGQSTPEPLAALWVREANTGILLTRHLTARDPWTQVAEGLHDLRDTLAAVAAALARLHLAGFRHRDLKVQNLLVDTGAAGRPRVHWIDLDGLRRTGRPSDAVRLRDLARLCASFLSPAAASAGVEPAHWRRFLELYDARLVAGGGSPLDLAVAERATLRWATRHVGRNVRRGRPVT